MFNKLNLKIIDHPTTLTATKQSDYIARYMVHSHTFDRVKVNQSTFCIIRVQYIGSVAYTCLTREKRKGREKVSSPPSCQSMRHLGRDEIGELVSGPVFESFCYEVSPLKYRICIRIARLRFWIGTPSFVLSKLELHYIVVQLDVGKKGSFAERSLLRRNGSEKRIGEIEFFGIRINKRRG